MVWWLFKKKDVVESRLNDFAVRLGGAFSKIKDDILKHDEGLKKTEDGINKIIQWVNYLHNNHKVLNSNHENHKELTSKEIGNLKQWAVNLNENLRHQRESQKAFRSEFKEVNRKVENALNEYRRYMGELKNENKVLSKKLESIEKNRHHGVHIVKSEDKASKSSFEEDVISRIRPNRKPYIIEQIKELISQNKYPTKQIERIIVGEKKLCGRTSFYSYIKEMRYKGIADYASVGDNNILVLTK